MSEEQPKLTDQITQSEIVSEMKRSYLDYAMSVIVSRALPDVRDGLKPVHRRILYAMHRMGLHSTARFSKSAKVVGEVIGKFHPHGDSAIYEAMVRMAQDFSMRYPLVKGQGNFGSIDGDPPAAMRYTEAKLNKIAEEMLGDIDKDTVDFVDNFDGSLKEPAFLPAKLPNLLLMGAEGIAVGMATKIPPHNLTEIVNATIHTIEKAKLREETVTPQQADNNSGNEEASPEEEPKYTSDSHAFREAERVSYDVTVDDLTEYVKGPDFPTAGIIYGAQDIKHVYATGRGKIIMRAKVEEEDIGKGKMAIIVKELPYQTNKASLVEKIAHLVVDKKVTGITDLRDESDREGIRVVIELKRDASYKKVLNNLYKYTDLHTSFPVNMVALVDDVPQTVSLKTVIEQYLKHRILVVIRRSEYELRQAKHRAHILEGYLIALDNIDEVIKIIRGSQTEQIAKEQLMQKFGLSDIQSQAILDMQLKRLTGLEREKIEEELKTLRELIAKLEKLLSSVMNILTVVKEELIALRDKYGDDRKTLVMPNKPGEISDEELIENKEVFVVLTKEGYIKQIPRESFKIQSRGGKGVYGMETKETDNVKYIISAQSHDYIMFFTNQGRVFQERVWEIPQGSRTSKGKAIVNLLTLRPEEYVTSVLAYESVEKTSSFIFMATKRGTVKKTAFVDFANIKSNGIIAIKLDEGDELLWTRLTNGGMNCLLASRKGKAITFKEEEVRKTGRSSMGVRGLLLEKTDELIAADVFGDEEMKKDLLVITERGIGKRCNLTQFRDQHRGGKGVKIAAIDSKTGNVAFVEIVPPEVQTVIISSDHGHIVKLALKDIPTYSREAKGVILMRFSKSQEKVVSAAYM
jgi:DNA gyrase subunit A